MAISINAISRLSLGQTQQMAGAAQYNKAQKVANDKSKEVSSQQMAQAAQYNKVSGTSNKQSLKDTANISQEAMKKSQEAGKCPPSPDYWDKNKNAECANLVDISQHTENTGKESIGNTGSLTGAVEEKITECENNKVNISKQKPTGKENTGKSVQPKITNEPKELATNKSIKLQKLNSMLSKIAVRRTY